MQWQSYQSNFQVKIYVLIISLVISFFQLTFTIGASQRGSCCVAKWGQTCQHLYPSWECARATMQHIHKQSMFASTANTKGGSITVPLTSCLTGSDQSVLQIKTKIVSCHTADSEPVKQEVNGTLILSPLVFPGQHMKMAFLSPKERIGPI